MSAIGATSKNRMIL